MKKNKDSQEKFAENLNYETNNKDSREIFAENLKFYINLREKKQKDLADDVGFPPSTVSNWVSGRKYPRVDTIELIAKALGVSKSQLIEDRAKPANSEGKFLVPVLGRVQAGIPVEAVQDIIDYEEIPETMARQGEYFGLQIKGDSMTPRFCEGDVVIVRKQPDVDSGDIGIILVNDNDATIKKIIKSEIGISLVPLNPVFDVKTYSNEQIEMLPIQILGKVVELRAKF